MGLAISKYSQAEALRRLDGHLREAKYLARDYGFEDLEALITTAIAAAEGRNDRMAPDGGADFSGRFHRAGRYLQAVILALGIILAPTTARTQPAAPPAAPSGVGIAADLTKTEVVWEWAPNPDGKTAPTGFHIYCGDVANADAEYSYYTEMMDVPDPLARNFLVGPAITELLKAEGKPAPGFDALMHVHCVVIPYNAQGEATDQIAGVPPPVSRIYFLIK